MKYNGPKCRLCRREGLKLFLKGDRCDTQKCSVLRKNYAPGVHGKVFSKLSEYGKQLREKQKAKRIYGVNERQLRNYYKKVCKMKGDKSQNLLIVLSLRFDNILHLAGFASSRSFARQLISHNFFLVNDTRTNIPSMLLQKGDIINLKDKKEKSKIVEVIKNAKFKAPRWLKVDYKKIHIEILDLPAKDDLEVMLNPALIIEAYSR